MAPVAPNFDADIATILNALASCEEFNSKTFAASEGIARADNAITKLKRVLQKYGYKLENKRAMKIDDDGSGEATAVKTPKKAPAVKKPRVKTTPTPKKRKVADDEQPKKDNEEEAGVSDTVKNEGAGTVED